jgi:hypothetical protein
MISSLLGKSSWKCYVARLNARGGPECGVDALMLKESTIFAQYIGNMIVDRNKCREHASEQKNMNPAAQFLHEPSDVQKLFVALDFSATLAW